MRKFSLIFITLGLFALSLTVAFRQGSLPPESISALHGSAVESGQIASAFHAGFQAKFAVLFSTVMQAILSITGQEILWAVVLLAFMVELALLYPSVRIQLKQKKIHLFHKKLVDCFNRGELSYSDTEQELYKLYAVNERIHSRGAVLVLAQIVLFLSVLLGLNLMVNAPFLTGGSWSVLNFNLLIKPAHFLVPLLVSLLYFLHSLIKITLKEREDYLAPSQSLVAILFALVSSAVIYFFAGTFALALSVYFAALITFSTVRYLLVEQQAKAWGELAQKELIEMMRRAKPHLDHFEYVSRRWNHLPVVRAINFHLLEEALSMSLGLMLALSFFGVFEKGNELSANLLNVPVAMAILTPFPADETQFCTGTGNSNSNPTICNISPIARDNFDDAGVGRSDAWFKIIDSNAEDIKVSFVNYSSVPPNSTDELPVSCCLSSPGGVGYQIIKPEEIDGTAANFNSLWTNPNTPGCTDVTGFDCSDISSSSSCDEFPGCSWNPFGAGNCNAIFGNSAAPSNALISICNYQATNIERVRIASGCPSDSVIRGASRTLTADGGSGYYKWTIHRQISDEMTGEILEQIGDGSASYASHAFTFTETGLYKIAASDYFNRWNNTYASEAGGPEASCVIDVRNAPISLALADQPAVRFRGNPVELQYEGGPLDRTLVTWELSSGPGTLNAETGVYTPSSNPDDLESVISVRAHDERYPDNISNFLEISYGDAVCLPEFGFYDNNNQPLSLAGQTVTKNVFTKALYRFYIKNAVVPMEFEGATDIVDYPDSIVASHNPGVFGYDVPYIDLRFSDDPRGFSDTTDVTIWDPHAEDGITACRATVRFYHQGQGVRARSPKRVKISF